MSIFNPYQHRHKPPTTTYHRTKALPPEVQAKFQEVGKRFNVESQRRHAREMGDLHRKIKLKQEAMAALPTEVGGRLWMCGWGL